MNTTVILIIAVVITLLSLLLKFINVTMENVSIFRDIRKRMAEIKHMISQWRVEGEGSTVHIQFRLAISDWFSAIAIVLVSFLLIMEYVSTEMLTRAIVFRIGLLFSLLLFNLIFLSISTMERRLGYWIDEFMTIIGYICELIHPKENKEGRYQSSKLVHTPIKKKKRTTQSKKK